MKINVLLRVPVLLVLASSCSDSYVSGGGTDGGSMGSADGGGISAADGSVNAPCPGEGCPPPTDTINNCVAVPNAGPYGSRNLEVKARSMWLNTGVYLRTGQTAEVEALSGQWSRDGKTFYGAAGDPSPANKPIYDCKVGSLVARVHLIYDEMPVTCLSEGAKTTVTAHRDGTLFLSMLDINDGGEPYRQRYHAQGAVQVRVTSDADTVPCVPSNRLAQVDLGAIHSGILELVGRQISILTTTAAVERDRTTAASSINLLDSVYDAELELRGMAPFHDQRVRFIVDAVAPGYMLAGNPVRMKPALQDGTNAQRILRASELGTDVWGFAHELGHDFTMVKGIWLYQTNIESWPNLFTLKAREKLNVSGQPNAATYCNKKDGYLANPTYSTLKPDAGLMLCFLMEFQKTQGWQIWQKLFELLNQDPDNSVVPYDGVTDAPQ